MTRLIREYLMLQPLASRRGFLLFCLGVPLCLSTIMWVARPSPVAAQEAGVTAHLTTPAATPDPKATGAAAPAEPATAPTPGFPDSLFPQLPAWLSDPHAWAADLLSQALISLLQSVSTFLHTAVGAVLHSAVNVISQTPPTLTYDSPTVQGLWGIARSIANAALVLVVVAAGISLLLREQGGTAAHDVTELFTRLAIGALLVNTSQWWMRLAIDTNNGLCAAFGEATLPAWGHANGTAQAIATVLAGLIYLIAAVLLVLQQLMRLALLDVLFVAAPIGVLCAILPQTQAWFRRWSSAFFSTVFIQFVQVVALKLGVSLVVELAPQTPDAQIAGLLLGVAAIALTLKLPEWLRDHAGDGLGFARYYAYRQAAQRLDGGTRSGGPGSRPSWRASTRGGGA